MFKFKYSCYQCHPTSCPWLWHHRNLATSQPSIHGQEPLSKLGALGLVEVVIGGATNGDADPIPKIGNLADFPERIQLFFKKKSTRVV